MLTQLRIRNFALIEEVELERDEVSDANEARERTKIAPRFVMGKPNRDQSHRTGPSEYRQHAQNSETTEKLTALAFQTVSVTAF